MVIYNLTNDNNKTKQNIPPKKKQRFQSEKKRKNNRGTKLKRTYVQEGVRF